MNRCIEGVRPIYYNNDKQEGLAIEPYGYVNGEYIMDEVRAFVVMEFSYTFFNPYEIEQVTQAFYRSTGTNSQEQFGEGVSDMQARGTWIPTNGLVMKAGYKDHGVCVMSDSGFILKKPFATSTTGTLLSRFHDDVQLAIVSYLMGGGIWNLPQKVGQLAEYLVRDGFPDITKEYAPGCVGLTSKMVPALARDINYYIGESVSWNWHPLDVGYLEVAKIDRVDLNDGKFWLLKDGRWFIPEGIFMSPQIINSFLHNKTFQRFNPEMRKRIVYGSLINQYNRCPTKEPPELRPPN